MRILVTGGAGFIGSNLVRNLVLDARAEVLNVDKLTYAGNPDNLAEISDRVNHRLVVADIADAGYMQALIEEFRPQAIMNLAAESHVDRSIETPLQFIQTNVTGTGALLAGALRYWSRLPEADQPTFRFVQVSTDEVFGDLGSEGSFTEDSPYRPSSPYAASKAGGDHLAFVFHRTYGLPVIVTHSSNNYGPYQFPEKLIPTVVFRALEGAPIPVYGKGENVRDWLYVDDHVSALRRILEAGRPGQRYLIGTRVERRNIDLVHEVCRILDVRLPTSPHRPHANLVRFVADRPGHDLRYAMDPSLIENELSWHPQADFDTALDATVAWYLENHEWCQSCRGRYDGKRMGLGASDGNVKSYVLGGKGS